ncbi:Coiled-coil domain-containing protein 17 [Entophlyctis luteolus]|nr:Coiled-coil domain-containing protein 17 [Entophlyctis luteolus]
MKEPKNRFSFERDKLAQERAKIQRELADLDKRFSAFAGPESATTDINLRRPSDDRNHDTDWLLPIVPLPSVIHEKLNPDNDVDLADENERLTDQVKSNSDLNATSMLLREISAIRMDYLRSGGTNKLLLDQMNALEAQFTHLASGGQQASLDFADEERAEKDDPAFHPSTFDVIDLINIPPYEEHRGLSVFMDVITGIPYYGGGSVVKMDLSYTVFNGSVVASPVESAIAMCSRKALSFTGRSVVQDFQRFFDASSLTVSFEGVKFFYKEGLIDEREMIPVAWTAIDLFQENLELNQGRWRVSMFYPPVDFNITTYHLHETVPPIPNMQFYMRIVNPILQPHHRRVDITQVDVRVNATVSTEYLFYKPLYNVFDYYDQMSNPNLKDRGDGSLMGSRSNLGAGGSLLGSKMLGSSASMDVKPLQYCRVGIRVDEITNLFVDVGSSDIFAVVTVGTTIVDWRSPPAEEGFTSGSYGWSEDTAELWVDAVIDLETKVSLGIAVNENENGQPGLTEELAVVNLFLQTENDTPVLNEGTFLLQARLSDSSYCTLNVKIFVADTRPPPYNFESTRLSRPIPYGAFFKIGDDPNVERSPYTAILGPFDLHIDGVDRGGVALDEFEKAEGFCDLQSPAFFPQFDISARVKPYKSSGTVTAATRVNGTLTAVIKIFTIDMYTQQLLTVGIAFFNLFLASPPVADAHDPTQNNWPQPESANVQPIYLNEGYHQVPVFVWNEKTKMKATFVGACKTNKVIGCSVLLRLTRNGDLPKRPYQDQIYNSLAAVPPEYEADLFCILVKERPTEFTVQNALDKVKLSIKAKNEVTDEALMSWMARRIAKEDGVLPGLEMCCVVKQRDLWGFRISVDCAEHLQNKATPVPAFSIAIVSIVPPGNFYAKQGSLAPNEVCYNRKLNFSSSVRHPAWDDGFMACHNSTQRFGCPFNKQAFAVVDIRCVGYSAKDKKYSLQSQGWTAVSVFHDAGFVKFGVFQFPLFEGPPTADVLAALAGGKAASTPEHPVALDAALAALIKAKRIHYAKRRGVVFVRICDARRFRELKFAKASQS